MRQGYIDALRALAVIWMIIFHTTYDLNMFGFMAVNFSDGFWYAFPRVIAGTFLFCVGLSLNITHTPSIKWHSLLKRSIKLGLAALAISVVSYIMFPSQWIYFGTLHCILVGSFLGALVVHHRLFALFVFSLIISLQYGLDYDIKWVSTLLQRQSLDFIPIYPWFWTILLGILLEPYLSRVKTLRELKVPNPALFLGRHSLKIYLLHQPLIYAILFLIKSFIPA